MRLALVADKAEAYTGFERDRILEEWSVERAATRKVERLGEGATARTDGGSS